MQNKSYQNNIEFHRMMQKMIKETDQNEKIKQVDDSEKLLRLKEQMYKTQYQAKKELQEAKDKDAKAKNDDWQKYLEQLRRMDKRS